MDAERDRQEEARRGTAPWLGLGASHQAGWTGVVARAMHPFATTSPDEMLELGKGRRRHRAGGAAGRALVSPRGRRAFEVSR